MINNNMSTIPKNRHALIKFSRLVLSLPDKVEVTYDHATKVKSVLLHHLNEHKMSPRDIQNYYGVNYTDFGMFLKRTFDIQLRSFRDAAFNYAEKTGSRRTEKKYVYWDKCRFDFDPYKYKNLPGYNLLIELGIYRHDTNPQGVCRDHILSIADGFRQGIDPEIISHPANCQFITYHENNVKNSDSWISKNVLLERIQKWNKGNFEQIFEVTHKRLPRSEEHKKKISKTNSQYMTITDGKINKRIPKTESIPQGFRRGMTRKKV